MEKMTEETLKIEHQGLMITTTVWTSADGKRRRTKIDGQLFKVYPSIYPKDKWTTDSNQAKR